MTLPKPPERTDPVRFTEDDLQAALLRWRQVAPAAQRDLVEAPNTTGPVQ